MYLFADILPELLKLIEIAVDLDSFDVGNNSILGFENSELLVIFLTFSFLFSIVLVGISEDYWYVELE